MVNVNPTLLVIILSINGLNSPSKRHRLAERIKNKIWFNYILSTGDTLYLLKNFFLMWTIFKVFIEFVTILLMFCFGFFGCEACGILAPWPGNEPAPLALEGEVSTTGPPGKSLQEIHFGLKDTNRLKVKNGGFPGGAVVKTLPANAGDTGSSPGPGRSHMLQSN